MSSSSKHTDRDKKKKKKDKKDKKEKKERKEKKKAKKASAKDSRSSSKHRQPQKPKSSLSNRSRHSTAATATATATPTSSSRSPHSADTAASTRNVEVYRGPPDEETYPGPEGVWPEGWLKITVVRRLGDIRRDRYFYSPSCKKFRSMNEVAQFLDILSKTDGDEDEAWKQYKTWSRTTLNYSRS